MANYTESDITTDEQAALDQVKEETEAAVKYDIAAKKAKNPVTKEAMEHNKKDEIEHAGLMGAVAVRENPENKEDMMNGVKELDNFLKKSISQCIRERNETGVIETFKKADIPVAESDKVNILESFTKAYYRGTNYKNSEAPYDSQYYPGKNRSGFLYNDRNQIKNIIHGPEPRKGIDMPEYEKNIDLANWVTEEEREAREAKDKEIYDAIYNMRGGSFDQNISRLLENGVPVEELVRVLRKHDFSNFPKDGANSEAGREWAEDIDRRTTRPLYLAMNSGKDIRNPLFSQLINPSGSPMLSGYYSDSYGVPDMYDDSAYDIPEDDEGFAAFLPSILNRINDLKLRGANIEEVIDNMEKEKYNSDFINVLNERGKGIRSKMGDLLDVLRWDIAKNNKDGAFYPKDLFSKVEEQFGKDIASKLESGQIDPKKLRSIMSSSPYRNYDTSGASRERLANAIKMYPEILQRWGREKADQALTNYLGITDKGGLPISLYDAIGEYMRPTFASSPFYNALRGGGSVDKFIDMYNHIKKYPKAYRAAKGSGSKVEDILKKGGITYDADKDTAVQEYLDSNRGPEEVQYLIDALFDGDNTNLLVDDVLDALNSTETLGEAPKSTMVDANARDLSKLYSRGISRKKNAEEIPQILSYIARNKVNDIDEDKVNFIKTQLENIQNKKKSELNFKDPDYQKLKDQVFKVNEDVPYPDNSYERQRASWNKKAIDEMEKPESLNELHDEQQFEQEMETNPELFRQFNEYRDELLKEGRKYIDQSTHDPILANNLLKYLKRVDRDNSYYTKVRKNLEDLRTGNKGYAMANLLNDPKFTSLISQYAADTMTPEGDLDDNGRKDRETFLATTGKDAGLLYDPKNAPLRELLDIYGLAFNGQGLSSQNLIRRLEAADEDGNKISSFVDNKGHVLDKTLDKGMLADLVGIVGGSKVPDSFKFAGDVIASLPKTTIKGNETFKGIDIDLLDDTDPDYNKSREAIQALNSAMTSWSRLKATKDRDGALPDYKQKQFDELEENIPKWFTNLMKGEGEIWRSPLGSYDASSVVWNNMSPDEIYDRFSSSIRSQPTKWQRGKWKWDPHTKISKYNVDYDAPQNLNKLRGYNEKQDASNRILQIASAILGPIGAESVPRAYSDKELEKFANGEKEYNLPANVLTRVIQTPSAIGRGYGGDAIVWKDLQKEDMDALAERMENLYSEFIDSGAEPGNPRFVKQIPNVPLEYQGEFDYDKAFDELKSIPPAEITGDIKDVVSEVDAQVGGSPKASQTKPKESKAKTTKAPKEQKSAKTTPTAASADTQAVYKSVTSCTRVRIRSSVDDLPDDTGLTMKDIREPTMRTDANGSSVKKVGSSAVLKSTSELMRSMRRH